MLPCKTTGCSLRSQWCWPWRVPCSPSCSGNARSGGPFRSTVLLAKLAWTRLVAIWKLVRGVMFDCGEEAAQRRTVGPKMLSSWRPRTYDVGLWHGSVPLILDLNVWPAPNSGADFDAGQMSRVRLQHDGSLLQVASRWPGREHG